MEGLSALWVPIDDTILEFGVTALVVFDAEVNISEIGRRLRRALGGD